MLFNISRWFSSSNVNHYRCSKSCLDPTKLKQKQCSICDVRVFLLFSRRPKMFHVCTGNGESSCGIVLPGYNGFIWNCISIETHGIYAYQHCPCCSKMVWTCVPKFLNYCQKTLKSAVWGLREPAFLAPPLIQAVPTNRWH